MTARIAADLLVALHMAFVIFVVAGGFLVLRAPAVAALHLPAVAWGAFAELTATVCPLTPLENALRHSAGEAGYTGSFVERYLMPILYPVGLTPFDQRWIGVLVIAINVVVYAVVVLRLRQRRRLPNRMEPSRALAQRME
jgi:hypothetical protein